MPRFRFPTLDFLLCPGAVVPGYSQHIAVGHRLPLAVQVLYGQPRQAGQDFPGSASIGQGILESIVISAPTFITFSGFNLGAEEFICKLRHVVPRA
ncbi:MAG TPA: hypothetical protein ENI17_02815 [Pseudomonas xinjiangensis]|uniref:Uncharacterized protein n=1 Tax=Halopseudomonas xinjiangensis TaxID=487184 RepID=A0A7V1BS62_9GAMM|nr:hypothetical protein [Halopseudomonas xinjiangensis]HEC46541.1 hypothetical protein [Halopseudomonas xinjiangensis]